MIKRGQVAIYVVLALVIIGAVAVYFVLRENVKEKEIPASLISVYDFYQSCIEQQTREAVSIAATQGGHIEVPSYVPGSEFAPFSSQLNFLGFPVPYWYYVSANGVIKEQIPSKSEIEKEIADYVKKGLKNCDFESFERQGFVIEKGESNVDIEIQDKRINVDVNAELKVGKGDDSARKVEHKVEIDSKFGKFYNLAKEIYTKQKDEAFLEKYALDVLYSYAPVDGVEIQCGPRIWSTLQTINDIRRGLEENIVTLKFEGNYYKLKNDERKYFVINKGVDESVRTLYSRTWSTKIEIIGEGVDDEVMIAESVGTQEGLGAMGFCYAPYHFVYDLSFPVLIQIYDSEELFQFPVVVIVDKNMPRQAVLPETPLALEEDFNLCEFQTQELEVNIYDINLNKVNANLSFECFNQRCNLGKSKDGKFAGNAPSCLNGFLHVSSGGYEDKKQLLSSNSERFVNVVLDREHKVKLNVSLVGSLLTKETAIVIFSRDDGKTKATTLPGREKIELSEGSYEVKVYVYDNSTFIIPGTTKTQCVEVPREGFGLFGGKKEKCFNIDLPEKKIEYSLIGGGKLDTYILESDLERGGLTLEASRFARPNSIEQLARNFELFDAKRIGVEFYDA